MRITMLLMLAMALTSIAAQTSKEVEITAEPHHHLVFENKYARVFKVEVPSGEATLMHWHRHDYAYVTLGPAELLNDVKDKPSATLKLQNGETRFSPGPFAHSVREIASTPFRNITIEFLHADKRAESTASPEEERGLEILEGGTQEILFTKDGVRASDVQLNPGGTLPKAARAAGQLIVSITAVDLRRSPVHGRPGDIAMKAGEVHWQDIAPALANAGKQPVRFIRFEFR